MRKSAPALAAVCLLAASRLLAVTPQKWEMRTREDFLRGKFSGVSVSSDGALFLAPRADRVPGAPSEEFFLSLLPTADGDVFLGTGHGGKVYRIGRDGKSEVYFQASEMDVTALARDARGVLYAATSPNGRIYKITAAGKGQEFFNPSEKYIWDLLFQPDGSLLAAVGESGGVYQVSPAGEGKQVLKAAENHILCLRDGGKGDVFAGSGGDGLIYRFRAGKSVVLFESPYEEIRSLVVDKDGNVYAAASGTTVKPKTGIDTPPPAAAPPVRADAEVSITVSASADAAPQGAAQIPAPSGSAAVPTAAGGGKGQPGAVFKVDPDGVARMLWSSPEEMVYSVALRDNGRLLFATGPKGRLYALDGEDKLSLLTQEPSEQVYALEPRDGSTYVVANNPATLSVLAPGQRLSGEYLSPVIDARTVASWGRVSWDAATAAGTVLQVQTRSGNTGEPGDTWSDWSPPYQKGDEPILSPKGRFLQVRALMKAETGQASPSLRRLTLFYLQTNTAPRISRLEFLKPNEVYLKLPEQDDVILGLESAAAGADGAQADDAKSMYSKKVERKGFRTVVWDADDENGDALAYAVSLRKDGEADWRLVQDRLTDSIFTFDTQPLADGVYYLKLSATDAPSNPAGRELAKERVSAPFVIDNSVPTAGAFTAARTGDRLDVAFRAEDAFSNIQDVRVLVRPGDWQVVFPVDGISDSRAEDYKLSLKLPNGSDGLITIRVRDSFGNVGVYRKSF